MERLSADAGKPSAPRRPGHRPSGDWLQGRIAYGGLTGALCVEAAARLYPDLPPLRNAHFALALYRPPRGPFGGGGPPGQIRRRHRGLGDRGRRSRRPRPPDLRGGPELQVRLPGAMPPAVPAPEACTAFFAGRTEAQSRPSLRRSPGRRCRPMTPGLTPGSRSGSCYYGETPEGLPAGLADAVPRSAGPLPEFALSFSTNTETWSLDLISAAAPSSTSGWWLLDSRIYAAEWRATPPRT
jgi:hypothetical protein